MRTTADFTYLTLLKSCSRAKPTPSRNHATRSTFSNVAIFEALPLVTVRKTAAKKAISEMQWFLFGNSDRCPENLLDWWAGQLNHKNEYLHGYRAVLQGQLDYVLAGIRSNPQSRRLVMSSWDFDTAPHITEWNQNPNTPTPCHLSYVQFKVNQDTIDMLSVQRSGDIMLGVPHNWVQHWYLLCYVCSQTGYKPGQLTWVGGDIHLYEHPTHLKAANEIVIGFDSKSAIKDPWIEINGQDAVIHTPGNYEPLTTIKPALL